MLIRSERNAKHPITFNPICKWNDEKYLPLYPSMYTGILPGYVISNYGTVFNIYTGEYTEWSLNDRNYPRVSLLFYRYGKVVDIIKSVDRLVLNTFDYNNEYDDNEYLIGYIDRDPLNCHIDNLRLYTPKEYYRLTKRKPKNHNITYQELRIH